MTKYISLKSTEDINDFCRLLDDRDEWNYNHWRLNDPIGLATIREYLPQLYKALYNEYFKGISRTKHNSPKATILSRAKYFP